MDFSFPVLAPPKQERLPLTTFSTVVHADGPASTSMQAPQPISTPTSAAQPARPPLTAFSTVVHADGPASTSMQAPQPILTSSSGAAQLQPGQEAATPAPVPVIGKAPRNKVMLEKGYSQMDWLRRTRSGEDLSGLAKGPPRKDITLEEVRQHRSAEDAWMVLRGKVYNVTAYMQYHPGGVAYMIQGAGKDATQLFNKYHPWVNADALMEACLIGSLAQTAPPAATGAGAQTAQAGAGAQAPEAEAGAGADD